LRTLSDLRAEGRLTARVGAWVPLSADLSAALALRERFPAADPFIRCNTLKGFVDGTLGASTAALLAPYADDLDSSGAWQWEESELTSVVRRADANGFQVTLHAIGDGAVHRALSAYDATGGGGRARRHRIEHAEVVCPG